MSLSIRLLRTGRKRINSFRIVVIDAKRKRDSLSYVCNIGYYLPQKKLEYLKMNISEYTRWLDHGAKPTKRVSKLHKIALENNQYVV